MSKPVKDIITKEYKSRYGEQDSACLVNVVGMDAITTNRLRGELKKKNIRIQIVKNSLARRAFLDTALAPLAKALEGPCALVTGGESVIDIAKTLMETKQRYPKLELKQGVLPGDEEPLAIEQLAKMKSRVELLGEIAMLLTSPGRRLAGCFAGPGGRIAGCVKAIADKSEMAVA
jgi:large subunit ribosomal protein L10